MSKICDGNCNHKKCQCGHCKSYHRLQYTATNTAPSECQQLDRSTLKQCDCKGFKP
jgi:hypothetical protein